MLSLTVQIDPAQVLRSLEAFVDRLQVHKIPWEDDEAVSERCECGETPTANDHGYECRCGESYPTR